MPKQITVKSQRDTMNKRQMCIDFLYTYGGREFDAIEASTFMRSQWGVDIDWHEFAYALDEMWRNDTASLVRRGDVNTYYVCG